MRRLISKGLNNLKGLALTAGILTAPACTESTEIQNTTSNSVHAVTAEGVENAQEAQETPFGLARSMRPSGTVIDRRLILFALDPQTHKTVYKISRDTEFPSIETPLNREIILSPENIRGEITDINIHPNSPVRAIVRTTMGVYMGSFTLEENSLTFNLDQRLNIQIGLDTAGNDPSILSDGETYFTTGPDGSLHKGNINGEEEQLAESGFYYGPPVELLKERPDAPTAYLVAVQHAGLSIRDERRGQLAVFLSEEDMLNAVSGDRVDPRIAQLYSDAIARAQNLNDQFHSLSEPSIFVADGVGYITFTATTEENGTPKVYTSRVEEVMPVDAGQPDAERPVDAGVDANPDANNNEQDAEPEDMGSPDAEQTELNDGSPRDPDAAPVEPDARPMVDAAPDSGTPDSGVECRETSNQFFIKLGNNDQGEILSSKDCNFEACIQKENGIMVENIKFRGTGKCTAEVILPGSSKPATVTISGLNENFEPLLDKKLIVNCKISGEDFLCREAIDTEVRYEKHGESMQVTGEGTVTGISGSIMAQIARSGDKVDLINDSDLQPELVEELGPDKLPDLEFSFIDEHGIVINTIFVPAGESIRLDRKTGDQVRLTDIPKKPDAGVDDMGVTETPKSNRNGGCIVSFDGKETYIPNAALLLLIGTILTRLRRRRS